MPKSSATSGKIIRESQNRKSKQTEVLKVSGTKSSSSRSGVGFNESSSALNIRPRSFSTREAKLVSKPDFAPFRAGSTPMSGNRSALKNSESKKLKKAAEAENSKSAFGKVNEIELKAEDAQAKNYSNATGGIEQSANLVSAGNH